MEIAIIINRRNVHDLHKVGENVRLVSFAITAIFRWYGNTMQ